MTDQPRLPLSAKGIDPEHAHDHTCDAPACTAPATDYLFMGTQFCDTHRHLYVPSEDDAA